MRNRVMQENSITCHQLKSRQKAALCSDACTQTLMLQARHTADACLLCIIVP